MSYAHNEEADFAASQLAIMFAADPALCFSGVPAATRPAFSACAAYEPSSAAWPLADGVISLVPTGRGRGHQVNVALEYKRESEGIHGLLTAIGQTMAYVHKGYNGAVIVIPRSYSTLANPANHVVGVLDANRIGPEVGVFDYEPPDKTSAYPFHGKIRCIRPLTATALRPAGVSAPVGRPTTQWAHLREGSTTRDAICGYLQSAIRISTGTAPQDGPDIPNELVQAITRIDSTVNPEQYLSYTSDNRLGSRIWRDFWFRRVATRGVLTPFQKVGGVYQTPGAFTGILRDDAQGHSQIFEGRATGLKETIVEMLNAGQFTEDDAWGAMAAGILTAAGQQNKQGVRARAHSYREDIDSAVAQLHWIDNEGRPTDQGYKFVAICERFGGPNSNAAIEYFGATMIQVGRFGSFLHYVHRLSEQMFSANPLAFTRWRDGRPVFTEDSYWEYLGQIRDHLVDDLKVMNTVSGRARPRQRTLFQAELTFLRKYKFIPESVTERYRLGVGLPINWIRVHEAMGVEL